MKILILLLSFCFPTISQAALTFVASTTDKVTYPSPQTIGAGSKFTFWQWVMRTSDANGEGTSLSSTIDLFCNDFSFTDAIFANVPRAGVTANFNSLANAFPQNVWTFYAVTYSETNGLLMYRGTLTSTVVALTPASNTIGSGNTTASTAQLVLSNRNTSIALSSGGKIASFGWITRELSLQELVALQFGPKDVSGTTVYSELGFNGTGTQTDLSGNGNSGVITGATQSSHVPLAPFLQTGGY